MFDTTTTDDVHIIMTCLIIILPFGAQYLLYAYNTWMHNALRWNLLLCNFRDRDSQSMIWNLENRVCVWIAQYECDCYNYIMPNYNYDCVIILLDLVKCMDCSVWMRLLSQHVFIYRIIITMSLCLTMPHAIWVIVIFDLVNKCLFSRFGEFRS